MIKILKKILLLSLTLTIFITSIPLVNAKASLEYPDTSYGSGSSGGGSGRVCGDNRTYCATHNENGITRSYKGTYTYTFKSPELTTIGVYNMQNDDIVNPDLTFSEHNLPLSGTAIGLNIHENKVYYASLHKVIIEVYDQVETKKITKYKCKYKEKTYLSLPDHKADLQQPKDENNCQYERYVDSATEECPVINFCESVNIKNGKGYPTAETIEETVTTDLPDKKIEIIITETDTTNVREPKFKTITTQISKGGDIDDIDFEYVVEAIEYAARKFFHDVTRYSEDYYASYNVSLNNSNDNNSFDRLILTQDDARKTAKWSDINGQSMSCTKWLIWNNRGNEPTAEECRWHYTPGEVRGDTYYFGGVSAPGALYDLRIIDMEYKIQRACLDPQTGNVSYKTGTSKCDENHFEISNDTINGEEHWHYFIPLNAKSFDGVTIQLEPAIGDSKLSITQCTNNMKSHYILAENSTEVPSSLAPYTQTIKPANGEAKFKGDYYCTNNCDNASRATFDKDSSSDYQNIVDNNGCYKGTIATIPVKQLFYNETLNNTLEGFNFYYKPINVNDDNPINIIFPNGISASTRTLWDGWYDAQINPTAYKQTEYNNLQLSNSYNNVTYVATNINANKIRKYNKDNPYTSWNNMDLNGTSSFIGTELGIVERLVDTSKQTYKLGCGPLNKNQFMLDENGATIYDATGNEIKNILYRKECGTS